MTEQLQDRVSDFSEIDESPFSPHVIAFARAVLWGTIAGGGIFLLVSVPVAIAALIDGYIVQAVGVALLPLGISGAGTLAGMLLLGLPVTAILHALNRETARNYALAGTVLGLVSPAAMMAIAGDSDETLIGFGMFLGLFGLMAGGVSSNIWGQWRQACAAQREVAAVFTDQADPHPNPIHDLLF
ncbi:MAG: hypothetical protein KDE15_10330 [Erythrobacter sp.]|nr:hypothetical protein [Erythrobacter sp.]